MKQFWKYVNSCLKSCSVIDSLRKSDDSITNSDEEKAKLFNEFFTSVFTHKDTSFIPTFQLNKEVPVLDSITTSSIIYNKLKNLKHNKSSGPEGWPVLALKEAAQELSIPLPIIFNKSLQSSSVPKIWKQAFVDPFTRKAIVLRLKIIVQLV